VLFQLQSRVGFSTSKASLNTGFSDLGPVLDFAVWRSIELGLTIQLWEDAARRMIFLLSREVCCERDRFKNFSLVISILELV
jgi:hypothetical protein